MPHHSNFSPLEDFYNPLNSLPTPTNLPVDRQRSQPKLIDRYAIVKASLRLKSSLGQYSPCEVMGLPLTTFMSNDVHKAS